MTDEENEQIVDPESFCVRKGYKSQKKTLFGVQYEEDALCSCPPVLIFHIQCSSFT